MGINFSKLQAGFKEYLLNSGEITQEEYDSNTGGISIFTHMSEFKDFLKAEYDCSDVSIFSMDINDIMKMELEDGKLVNPNESGDEEFSQATETPEETPAEGSVDANGQSINGNAETANDATLENIDLITGVLNELLQDDQVKSVIDNDADGNISEEELTDFLEDIKGYDNDDSNISLEDIIGALKDIEEGTFNQEDEEEPKEEIDEIKETSKPTATNRSSGSSGSGAAGVRGASGGNSGISQPVEKTLDNMNKDELNAELNTAQSDLSEKQATLDSILNDSDPTIAGLKSTMDDAYQVYEEELAKLDENMAEDLNDLKTKIDDKQKEIDTKDQEISDQECVVSDAETAYDNAVSAKNNWENIISELENTDTSEMSSDQKAKIESKKTDAQNNLNKAEQAVTDAKEALDEAKEKLEDLETEKEDLISGDNESSLEVLNQQMETLESSILDKYPEMKQYMDAYKSAKEDYTETKAEMTESAKQAVSKSQEYVNEVQTAINNYDNKQNERNYAVNDLQAAVEWARKYDDYSQEQIKAIFEELGYQFDYNAWCADFVRMALGEAIGDENLPEWYQNCSNKAYCPTIQQYGEGHQVSAEEAQAGDIVLYDWDGDGSADHVGLFVDNGDGSTTITAIEGNTSGEGGGSCVEEKARDRSSILGIYSMHNV